MDGGDWVLDACCLMNLLACGREQECLRALGVRALIHEKVRCEVMYLVGPVDDEGQPTRVEADQGPLEAAGLLVTLPGSVVDADTLVETAARLTDCDACTLALAATQCVPLASDDRKVRRVAQELFPGLQLLSTSEILRQAAHALGLSRSEVVSVVTSVYIGGNFRPRSTDPDGFWFLNHMSEDPPDTKN